MAVSGSGSGINLLSGVEMMKHCKTSMFCLLLSLLVLALFPHSPFTLPEAQASSTSETKYPTETEQIEPNWLYPEKAYIDDDDYAYTIADEYAIQKYYGFGFSYNDSVVIDKILVRIHWKFYVADWASNPIFIIMSLGTQSFNGEIEMSLNVENYLFYEVGDYEINYGLGYDYRETHDITQHFTTLTLPNITVQITGQYIFYGDLPSGGFEFYLDSVSVEVAYHTCPVTFSATWLMFGTIGGFILGMGGVVLFVKRRSKPN